jgi:hypothetical protein
LKTQQQARVAELLKLAREKLIDSRDAAGTVPNYVGFDRLVAACMAARDLRARPDASRRRIARGLADVERRLKSGGDIAPVVLKIERAATGLDPYTRAQRQLQIAIAMVALHSDDEWTHDPRLSPVTDEQLCRLVCQYLVGPTAQYKRVAARLEASPAAVANAVRMWRRPRGRPRGARSGSGGQSRWRALGDLERLAGIGDRSNDAVEQTWKDRGADVRAYLKTVLESTRLRRR